MRFKALLKPAAAVAASLAVVIAANAVIPMLQGSPGGTSDHTISAAVDNYFSVTAYAKELTETGKVYPGQHSSLGYAMCGEKNGGISFGFPFPVECKGENIDTITYSIKQGAFYISHPRGKSVVIDGEKLEKEMNVPGRSMESEEKEILTYQHAQYKSFTVKYDKQTTKNTCIDIVDTSDAWSKERVSQYKKLGFNIIGESVEAHKEVCDFLTKDLGITCTVTYTDGSTESKDIVVSNEIGKPSEALGEEIPEEKDGETVIRYFSIQ